MEFLYHYTKLDTLELILKSKKMRFNSLLNVDDSIEGTATDLINPGKYVFVSCFTDDEKELIPIWSMYGDNGKGIRIKMKNSPFEDLEQKTPYTVFSAGHDVSNRYTIMFFNEAYKVEYLPKNEMNIICPSIVKDKDIDIGKIGLTKIDDWEFQNEVRFILNVFPIGKNELFSMYNDDIKEKIYKSPFVITEGEKNIIRGLQPFQMMIENMKKSINLPITYYDMKLKEEVINNFEITLGYAVKKEDRHKIKNIVRQYNKLNNGHITVKNSELKIRNKY